MNPGDQRQSAISENRPVRLLSRGHVRRGDTTRGARILRSFLDAIAGDPLWLDAGPALPPEHRQGVALGLPQLALAFSLRRDVLASRLHAPGVGR
jgi:hypothetical protein